VAILPPILPQPILRNIQELAMSMITATAWVPRGFAAQFPTKYEFNQDEFDRIAKLAKLQLDDAQEDLEEAESKEGVKLPNTIAVSNTKEYACDSASRLLGR